MNAYPMTSTTFIRREIEALEAIGVTIDRYAVREWDGKLVDARDMWEKKHTRYLLSDNIANLIGAAFLEPFLNPSGFSKGLRAWARLVRASGGGFVKHVAYLMQAAHFRQLAKKNSIDHVHVHFATNATAVAMLSKCMGGPSYSFTVHGPDELLEMERLSFRSKIEDAAFVVAISEYCKSILSSVAGLPAQGRIIVARCGIALEEFGGDIDLPCDNFKLICVGRLCPQKGQVLIPKAVSKIRSEFPQLEVILVGDGESRAAIEAEIRKWDVAEIVELRGWMANPEVLDLIGSSRALLLPSFAEGLPVVIMESLALGRPVISTTIAGIPELVDRSCGWLFPAGDEEALVLAMRAALACTNIDLTNMARAGRERVFQLHDRRKLANILLENFQRTGGQK